MFNDFLKHIFPRVVRGRDLRITYTFCLGGLAFTSLMLLVGSGLLLMLYYRVSPTEAFESILYLERSVFGGRYLRSLHRLASHSFLILIFLHTMRVLVTGAYAKPREKNWIIGCCLLFLALFEGYTGYLLPMDQLALWATQTGMQILEMAPFGSLVKQLLVPDGVGESLSLVRFYALHIVFIPMALVILSMLHFYQIRKRKGLLPYL